MLVTAFAPLGWFWLAPLLLAFFLLLLEYASPREAGWLGFSFGFGLFAAGTWWLYISLNILGGLWPPLAVLLMLGLVVIMAAYTAAVGYLVVRFSQTGNPLRWLVLFPGVWTVAEWLRGWVLTGFPWMSLGYSQVESPLGWLAPVGGVYGVSLLVVLLAGALVTTLLGKSRDRYLSLGLLLSMLIVAAWQNERDWSQPTERELRIRLVQGAIPQDRKWQPEQRQPTLELYRRLSASDEPLDLIVWPEAAVPALPFEVQDFLSDLHADLVARDTDLFLGILTFDLERDEFLNTLWSVGPTSGQYHKRHLVPFGEYFPVPDFVRKVMRLMNLPSENVSAGTFDQRPLYAGDVPIAPTICYEIAYGAEQLMFFPEAEVMVNVSNDAWFGDTIAPHQHLQINQFRARETGRYMLRSTNTGITAVIDHRGRIVERLPQFEPGALDAMVEPRTGMTPYLAWGNLPVISLAFTMILAGALASRRIQA